MKNGLELWGDFACVKLFVGTEPKAQKWGFIRCNFLRYLSHTFMC